MIASPHRTHEYFPNIPAKLSIVPNSLVCFNDSNGVQENCGKLGRESFSLSRESFGLPRVFANASELIFSPTFSGSELSVLRMPNGDSGWLIDTAFELALIVKNVAFVAKSAWQRRFVKAALLNCVICQSPFVLLFLPPLADFLQMQIPSTPIDGDPFYHQRLSLLGGFLRGRPDRRFELFYESEQRILTSRSARELAFHFPEFFDESREPQLGRVSFRLAALDPGAVRGNLASHVMVLRLFSRRYGSLVGFPFWDVLPLWIRVTSAWRGRADYIEPSIARVNETVICVSNPGQAELIARFSIRARSLPQDLTVLVSHSAMFDDDVAMLTPSDLSRELRLPQGDTYMSAVGLARAWDVIEVQLPGNAARQLAADEVVEIDISAIRERFVSDMRQFACVWTDADTDQLLGSLPRFALKQETFGTTESIAKGSALCTNFPQSVVVLRALVLHHFNFIREKKREEVPASLWQTFTRFVCPEGAADDVMRAVASVDVDMKNLPRLEVDRHAAHRLIMGGHRDASMSIIAQVSTHARRIGASALRAKGNRPWHVQFKDELAIDAGGPAHELMTEAAASIFERTTGLFIRSPDQESFLPWPMTSRTNEFWGIGVYIGVVVRTGLMQDLPFAPFIWRYLAGERIGVDDVARVDPTFRELCRNLLDGTASANWTFTNWNGEQVVLPGRRDAPVEREDVQAYIGECAALRLKSIRQYIHLIRKGLRENLGFKRHPLLTGALLSRLAQGNPQISVKHLKSRTRVVTKEGHFPLGGDDPYVRRFWVAVGKLAPEERRLLLKFITTLTRLPNMVMFPDFWIRIDAWQGRNPDESLPTASTCFNLIHLPRYSTDDIALSKIRYAIRNCQTMENR
jgi:hypothetical protein